MNIWKLSVWILSTVQFGLPIVVSNGVTASSIFHTYPRQCRTFPNIVRGESGYIQVAIRPPACTINETLRSTTIRRRPRSRVSVLLSLLLSIFCRDRIVERTATSAQKPRRLNNGIHETSENDRFLWESGSKIRRALCPVGCGRVMQKNVRHRARQQSIKLYRPRGDYGRWPNGNL